MYKALGVLVKSIARPLEYKFLFCYSLVLRIWKHHLSSVVSSYCKMGSKYGLVVKRKDDG